MKPACTSSDGSHPGACWGCIWGLASGLLAGTGFTWLVEGASALAVPLITVTTVCFGLCGALYDAFLEVRRRGRFLDDQNAAISSSAQATERRFAEMLEAKRQVELQVAQRTAQLQEALEQLRTLDRAKSEFFTNVSHELRTPLTLVLSPLEVMLEEARGDIPELQVVHRNATHLLQLINQILDLARVDAGGMKIRPEELRLVDVVGSVQRSFEPLARLRTIDLELKSEDPDMVVCADRKRLESVVTNLLANALKFTPAGGRISISLDRQDDYAQLHVVDTGAGIAPEDLPRVFDRFSRAGRDGEAVGGSGIGLALVQEVLHLHGGSISVESTEGVGTRFTANIPCREDQIPIASLEPGRTPAPAGEARQTDGEVPDLHTAGCSCHPPTEADAAGRRAGTGAAHPRRRRPRGAPGAHGGRPATALSGHRGQRRRRGVEGGSRSAPGPGPLRRHDAPDGWLRFVSANQERPGYPTHPGHSHHGPGRARAHAGTASAPGPTTTSASLSTIGSCWPASTFICACGTWPARQPIGIDWRSSAPWPQASPTRFGILSRLCGLSCRRWLTS